MDNKDDKIVDRHVTYTLLHQGRFYIVENVPARVNEETGEQFFSPATVEKLQQTIMGHSKPSRMIETSVFEYS